MRILDRYILRQFLLNFAILLVVLGLLFTVVNVLVDLDEFLEAGQARAERFGGVWLATLWTIADFNGPLILLIYVFFSGLIAVGAMGFTFAGLHRSGELGAMVGSGVSLHRVAVPVLLAGGLLSAATLPLQEFVLPRLAAKLVRSPSQLGRETANPFAVRYAPDGRGNLLSADAFDLAGGTLSKVSILERSGTGLAQSRITAAAATWDAQSGGWRLQQGVRVRRDAAVPGSAAAVPGVPAPGSAAAGRMGSAAPGSTAAASGSPAAGGAPGVGGSGGAGGAGGVVGSGGAGGGVGGLSLPQSEAVDWFPTDLTPEALLARRAAIYPHLLSLAQLQGLASGGGVDPGPLLKIIHSRFSLLVMNLLVLVMGLPFFLLREPANMLLQGVKAAGICLAAWCAGLVILQVGAGPLLNPVATAWLPVALYLPLSAALLTQVRT